VDVTNTYVERYHAGYSDMPWIVAITGIGVNATAGEAPTVTIQWKKEYYEQHEWKLQAVHDANLNAMTYVIEMTYATNMTYTHGNGYEEKFNLIMYTPADSAECAANQLTYPVDEA
jgi:hypothetical protein